MAKNVNFLGRINSPSLDSINKRVNALEWAGNGTAFDIITSVDTRAYPPGIFGSSDGNRDPLYGEYTTFSKIGNITGNVTNFHWGYYYEGKMPEINIATYPKPPASEYSVLKISESTQKIYLEHLLVDPTDYNSAMNMCYIDLIDKVAVKYGELVTKEQVNFDNYRTYLNGSYYDDSDGSDYPSLEIGFTVDMPWIYGTQNAVSRCYIPSQIVINSNIYRPVSWELSYGNSGSSVDWDSPFWKITLVNEEHYSFSEVEVQPIVDFLSSSANVMIKYAVPYDKYEDTSLITKTPVPVDFETTVILDPFEPDGVECTVGEMESSYLKKKEV